MLAAAPKRVPETRAHIRVTVIVGLGLFFDFFDVFLAGVIGTVLTTSFQLSSALLPVILGSSFLGMFFGATCMGTIADRVGRRPAYLINLGVYSLFTLLGAFSVNPQKLFPGFDPLGRRRHSERRTEPGDGPNDRSGLLFAREITDEALVDLDLIEGELPKVGERRVTRPEIIH